ncbi:hypothetical protein BGX27_006404 [Mortierella sp. AM989]|nr:hypothetical protein BGX27_006404 [Mortierella sp. AM989]
MFKGYSAWFSPELAAYKQPWNNHGGEEKELAEADIAFVSDKTSTDPDKYVPEENNSIQGRKRLSLKRYKRTFPALDDWNTSSYDDNMAVGMVAYTSTNTISFKPTSEHLYQPESGIQDLSVTDNSAITVSIENNTEEFEAIIAHESIGSSTGENRASERTQTLSTPIDDEQQEEFFDASIDFTDDLEFMEDSRPSPEHMQLTERDSEIVISSASLPKSSGNPSPRKRRLPETVQRTKRSPPAVRNIQIGDDFFGSSSEEEGRGRRAPKQLPDKHIGVRDMIQDDVIVSSIEPPQVSQESQSQKHAVVYLKHVLRQMDTEKKRLLAEGQSQLYIIDIASSDISLQPKKAKK